MRHIFIKKADKAVVDPSFHPKCRPEKDFLLNHLPRFYRLVSVLQQAELMPRRNLSKIQADQLFLLCPYCSGEGRICGDTGTALCIRCCNTYRGCLYQVLVEFYHIL